MDLEFNTKNISLVLPQAITAGATTDDGRIILTRGARALKIRLLAKGVAAGKLVTFVLKGGSTVATVEDNIIKTVEKAADANGVIDYSEYVKTPTEIYKYITGEATAAADAGSTVVVSVDVELTGLRESTNLKETPTQYE
ncbi:MAG: hypothetical protein XE08_0276 [Parcubacteria bacterium 32_520]|nr:MAG: hypothetical protein XD75_0583 [Parcubacteria bacterium 33_209]KUK99024.1 MAG: hypothetical protein XE08_0276 [Parcubacteria bacterium 32_520]